MAQSSKAGLIILIIFCVIFAGSAGAMLYLYQIEAAKVSSMQSELANLQNEKNKLDKQLSEAKDAREELQQQLSQMERKAESLEDEITQAKRESQSAKEQLQAKEQELNSIESKVAELRGELGNLEDKYVDLELENDELVSKLNQLRLAKKALESKIGTAGTVSETDSEEGVELGKVVVTPEIAEGEGRVLVVNREFDFVVIDLGKNNGIIEGTQLGVFRDGALLATVEVEKVYEDMSSAVIISQEEGIQILEDDTVSML